MATRSKQKALDRQAKADTRPCATAKFVRISPFKVRIVLDIKLVNSAAANGENNQNLARNDMYIAECFANEGPTLKRIQAVSKGRAYRINKRTSHITVILDTVKA